MHAVTRSSEPDYFIAIRCRYNRWEELYGAAGEEIRSCRNRYPAPCCTVHLQGLDGDAIRQIIRNALRNDFSGICAYCEQDCADLVTVIEHFRPRLRFPDEWITWANLVYACQSCDNQKGEKWPGTAGDPLASLSFVNPSASSDQAPAEDFFDYCMAEDDTNTDDRMVPGQVMPSGDLSSSDWWRAERTISDLDLNSDYGQVDARLTELRTDRLDFVLAEIGDLSAEGNRAAEMLRKYSQPDQPFSSYVAAFARSLGI